LTATLQGVKRRRNVRRKPITALTIDEHQRNQSLVKGMCATATLQEVKRRRNDAGRTSLGNCKRSLATIFQGTTQCRKMCKKAINA